MIENALDELEQAGVSRQADGRCCRRAVLERAAHRPPRRRARDPGADPARRRQTPGRTARLDRRAVLVHARVLATRSAKSSTANDRQSIEPVFGHTKHNRKIYRFNYRGRSLVRTEWRLTMLTHNLTKLHRHQIATAGAPKRAPTRGQPRRERTPIRPDRPLSDPPARRSPQLCATATAASAPQPSLRRARRHRTPRRPRDPCKAGPDVCACGVRGGCEEQVRPPSAPGVAITRVRGSREASRCPRRRGCGRGWIRSS